MTRIKTHSSILTMGDGGTWSYGGTADPLNMLPPFDKGIRLAMGQANVKRWSDDSMPLVTDETGPGVMARSFQNRDPRSAMGAATPAAREPGCAR